MFYKVVKCIGDELYSCFAPEPLRVEYVPGEKTTSPDGPLLVFDSLRWAKIFLDTMLPNEFVIWECVIGPTRPVDELLRFFNSVDPRGQAQAFWADKALVYNRTIVPHSTIATDWVILVGLAWWRYKDVLQGSQTSG